MSDGAEGVEGGSGLLFLAWAFDSGLGASEPKVL